MCVHLWTKQKTACSSSISIPVHLWTPTLQPVAHTSKRNSCSQFYKPDFTGQAYFTITLNISLASPLSTFTTIIPDGAILPRSMLVLLSAHVREYNLLPSIE